MKNDFTSPVFIVEEKSVFFVFYAKIPVFAGG